MKPWPEPIEKAWVVWEMLRRLKFSSDDIYVGAVTGDAHGTMTQVVRVELRTQGKIFGAHVALWTETPEKFEKIWRDFAAWANVGISDRAKQKIYDKHMPEFSAVGLVLAIKNKGIELP